jgi:selenocysteine lyase/cysteine desulfurase
MRNEWFPFDDGIYLNTAAEGVMPRAAVEAVGQVIEAKKYPHRWPITAEAYFEVPARLRLSLARLVGGHPDEIALTTGASAGAIAVAYNWPWKTGDEVLTGAAEFPLQYATWGPLTRRAGVTLRVVKAAGSYPTADDYIAALSPRTRLVSTSLVRFNDGSLLDARPLADACHAQGALLCLDVSQCCGAMALDAGQLGADFLTCAGYKWLLSPYGTGFFWIRRGLIERMRPGPFYWMATEGADDFDALRLDDVRPVDAARRWDTPEWAGSFNPNLAGMAAAVAVVEQLGPATVCEHNARLIDRLFTGLPPGIEAVSPPHAAARGPFGCFRAHSLEATQAIVQALDAAHVTVSLREGNVRVAPHLFNTDADIDRVLEVVASGSAARLR